MLQHIANYDSITFYASTYQLRVVLLLTLLFVKSVTNKIIMLMVSIVHKRKATET